MQAELEAARNVIENSGEQGIGRRKEQSCYMNGCGAERVDTFITSPLPDRMARAAIWGKQSGRLSNIIRSTPASPIPYHTPYHTPYNTPYPPCRAMQFDVIKSEDVRAE